MPPLLRNTVNFFKKHLFLSFSLLFLFLIIPIVASYYLNGQSLVWFTDGQAQHYPAYVYYGKYLREIIGNLFSGNGLIIPEWNFSIGEGADILTTLHYYCIGDPFAFFTALIPADFTWVYYDFSIILRLYLAGIVFIKFAKKLGVKNKYALLSGALSYALCGWAISKLCRHIFFLNPLIYLPLLLLGVEKILKKEKTYLFIFAVMISALSNFYFLWMLAIFTIIYVIVRLATSKEQGRIKLFLKISAFALLGLGLSAVILLPISHTVLENNRLSQENPLFLFYPITYYITLPDAFLGNSPSPNSLLATSIPAFLSCLLLCRHCKKYKTLFILHLILLLPIFIPAFAQILNGLSYVRNRYGWAYALLSSITLSLTWNDLIHLKKKDLRFLIISLLIFFLWSIIPIFTGKTISNLIFISLTLGSLLLFLIQRPFKNERQPLLLATAFLNLLLSGYSSHVLEPDTLIGTPISNLSEEALSGSASTVKVASLNDNLSSSDFFRFYHLPVSYWCNTGFTANLSGPNLYWSLINSSVVDYRNSLALTNASSFAVEDAYQSRTDLDTLTGIRYLVKEHDNSNTTLPPIYELIGTSRNEATGKEYDVYQNPYSLPLGLAYEKTLSLSDWNSLSTAKKSEALLKAVVLENGNSFLDDFTFSSKTIPYTISSTNGVKADDHHFTVEGEGSSLNLSFNSSKNSETILTLENLAVKPKNLNPGEGLLSPYNIDYFLIQIPTKTNPNAGGIASSLSSSTGYSSTRTSSLNLGYSETPLSSATLSFSHNGTGTEPSEYSFDNLYLESRPYDETFEKDIEALKESAMYDTKLDINTVTGKIDLEKPKTLLFTIPYSAGWTAFVDEEEVKIEKADVGYMAINLTSGHHDIRLAYKTPLKCEGTLISLASVLAILAYIIFAKRGNENAPNEGMKTRQTRE